MITIIVTTIKYNDNHEKKLKLFHFDIYALTMTL